MKPYRGRLHFDGSIRHELHAAIRSEEPRMERTIAMTFLLLAFSGIAWCLSKFALIGYRAGRQQLYCWRIRKLMAQDVTDQTAHLRRVK